MALRAEVEAILAALDAEQVEPYGEADNQEAVDAVYELEEKHGRDFVHALVEFAEGWSMNANVDELPRIAEDAYRGHHDSPGDYARSWSEETGSVEDQQALARWAKWIDWPAYAEGEMSDHEFIKISGKAGVFVFWSAS